MDEMENDTEGGVESDANQFDTKLQPEIDVLIAGDGSELPAVVPAPQPPIEMSHEERVAAWRLTKKQDYVKYAQKILQNPSYASEITSTELRFQDHDPEWGLLDISLFSEDDWSCIREFVQSLALTTEEGDFWMAAIRSGHWDALAAAVLPLLRNLTELRVPEVRRDYEREGSYTWIRKILDRVTSSQEDGDTTKALLPKLKSVFLAWYDTEDGMNFNDVLLFAQIKSVEYLKAAAVSDERSRSYKELHLNLKSVELKYSRVEMDSLGSFLKCCPKLETFSYEEGGSTVGFGWFEACKLGPALASTKNTLKELEILDSYTPVVNPPCDWEKPMGPILVDFPKLEKLHVMAIMLVGEPDDGLGSLSDISAEDEDEDEVEVEELHEPGFKKGILVHSLPRFLKELRLENCPKELLSELEELCELKDGEVPRLELVELDTWAGHDLESHRRLSAKFEAKGVKLISRPVIPLVYARNTGPV